MQVGRWVNRDARVDIVLCGVQGHFLIVGEIMIGGLLKKIFGTSHDRMMRRLQPQVDAINDFESKIKLLSDDELRRKTDEFKQRLDNGESLESILAEAFAVVREASWRTLHMRHYDVQLVGGIVLHKGMIAEMRTGEGKTLVATCPLYLNALTGKGAHLVTVNDYLADRDADWMGQIYKFLGLSVGKILTDMSNDERRESYHCDITYGTNNEFGFDYLRDNMKFSLDEYVQRKHSYAIVDEVDSILIDEARTPLIISGQIEQDLSLYYEINKVMPFLKKDEDYTVDEKQFATSLTDEGIEKVENHLKLENIYDPKNIEYLHHVNKALQAHTLYKKDQNYVVKDGKVVIVDDFTGRLMPGRRWSDGLHQAVEAKEGVEILSESRTLATITFQNYFRMYDKLAGMTGTADTEAEEFKKIYKLDVVVIPTNLPICRTDYPDVVYRSEREKVAAVIDQIFECHKKGQPVLVGTVSVEKSEMISKVLSRNNVQHSVLNAKNHFKEAEIVAQAGRKGAVTIATNMAGRGTDILLGGNPEFMAKQEGFAEPWYSERLESFKALCASEKKEVIEAGGLFILGTERHDSRRIDNQLRGRSGRQGDPGASRFYLSLEDDLMRIFGAERIASVMDRIGMQPGEPIESGMVSSAIEGAQKRVEGRNFDIRKNLLEYDDVMNSQRKVVYDFRLKVLEGENMREQVLDAMDDVVKVIARKHMPIEVMHEDWDVKGFEEEMHQVSGLPIKVSEVLAARGALDKIMQAVWGEVEDAYLSKESEFQFVVDAFNKAYPEGSAYHDKTGAMLYEELAQNFFLQEIDKQWREHLNDMASLRESISLRGYAQRDPKQEYKREGYDMFVAMLDRTKIAVISQLLHIKVERPEFLKESSARGAEMESSRHSSSDSRKLVEESRRSSSDSRKLVEESMQSSSDARKLLKESSRGSVEEGEVSGDAKAEELKERRQKRNAIPIEALLSKTITEAMKSQSGKVSRVVENRRDDSGMPSKAEENKEPELGRNDPCWCGSGKKYKHCHLER